MLVGASRWALPQSTLVHWSSCGGACRVCEYARSPPQKSTIVERKPATQTTGCDAIRSSASSTGFRHDLFRGRIAPRGPLRASFVFCGRAQAGTRDQPIADAGCYLSEVPLLVRERSMRTDPDHDPQTIRKNLQRWRDMLKNDELEPDARRVLHELIDDAELQLAEAERHADV